MQWREVGQTGWTDDRSGTLSGNTGTFAYTLLTKSNFSASTSYQIQLTVTDGNDTRFSTSMITVLTQGFAHIVLGGPNHPHSVGIGKTPTANEILDVGIGFSHTGGAVTLDAASKAAWLDALGLSTVDLLVNSEFVIRRSGRVIQASVRGVSAAASGGGVICPYYLSSYLPPQHLSSVVTDLAGHVARMWLSKDDGGLRLEPIGYTGTGNWYGTLTYIY